jgi:hypothetical protein
MVAAVLFAGVLLILGLQTPVLLEHGAALDWFYVVPLTSLCLFLLALGVAALGTRGSVATIGLACLAVGGYAVLVSPSVLSPSNEFLVAILGAIALPVLSALVAGDLRRVRGRRAWLVMGSGLAAALVLLYGGVWRYGMNFVTETAGIGHAIWWAYCMTGALSVATCLALAGSIRGRRGMS